MTQPAHFQVAIDGPASAGKSTIAKILATDLKYVYVDTGAMYRAITLAAKQAGLAYEDEAGIVALLPKIEIAFLPGEPVQHVLLNGQEVTEEIRSTEITNNVSLVSSYQAVRADLVDRQRALTAKQPVIMDGRDIGTTVLPDAQVKIFLIASVDERAERRFKENQSKGMNPDLATLKKEIEERDYKDSHRAISPLTKATDALTVDTTGQSIDQVVATIKQIIKDHQ
ncbi:(d)CMP kinase [Fructobacillus evanidus]|uniref:Cytidylate kinase n=1 Tax=Fructobacillus evanidus TaxID=3064281 RepID=A0ABN9YVJ9_9LACO|nr:Cytidylate kinase (Cmk) [Fructobacillus sp. LMG 32999]CAK1230629.1 Cytidylate kinase (Cmk) [Fructobacillus sp. LMG 32999]CAK1233392.1 Cytidylate kinase (Cmk) [Fructobacillus sp. LMG 32999]CAK1233582.1 Cytidylate kinase (Cmk) [Fructobacillus sp. LMG 32999]CAK1234677.1 Cytidylate kinase (Cmk) [Fructobacillus sp. LMG 32999]